MCYAEVVGMAKAARRRKVVRPEAANRVRELRQAQGISAAELARRAGIGRVFLHDVERHYSVPTIHVAHRISAALGLPVDVVFPGPASRDALEGRQDAPPGKS